MTIEALRRHRPETLGDLLEAYGRELQAVAYLILRDRADAEDIVVETLLTAFERGGSIRDERALRAWLIRVASNKALTLLAVGGAFMAGAWTYYAITKSLGMPETGYVSRALDRVQRKISGKPKP